VKKELAIYEDEGKREAYENLNSVSSSSVEPERVFSGFGRTVEEPKLDNLYMMRAWT
jgi:hypothetical protein